MKIEVIGREISLYSEKLLPESNNVHFSAIKDVHKMENKDVHFSNIKYS